MSYLPQPDDWEDLIQDYLDETISEKDFETLQKVLRVNENARDRYFAATRTAGLLREVAGTRSDSTEPEKAEPPQRYPTTLVSALSAGLLAMLVIAGLVALPRAPIAAHLTESANATWLSEKLSDGEAIRNGSQIQLASGSVELRFATGATTRLRGPVLFEIQSKNDGVLRYGEAFSVADTEESQGFTIHTASGDFVDQGTEFLTTASLDGYSQLHVTSGAVDVAKDGFTTQRVVTGNGVGIESGDVPIMIQIERGSETPDFEFPTISPPSSVDYASTQPVRITHRSTYEKGVLEDLSPNSGPVDVLTDGRSPLIEDAPSESLFFRDDTTGYLTFDLGSPQSIKSIQTYSWHRNRFEPEKTLRAVQRYTVWGRNDETASIPSTENSRGWTRIARVDTDAFFHVDGGPNRPPQQACRIFSNGDSIGEFRYLMFEVIPTSTYADVLPRHTFFSEIDIFCSE